MSVSEAPTQIQQGIASDAEVAVVFVQVIREELQFLLGDHYLLNQITTPPKVSRQLDADVIAKMRKKALREFITTGHYLIGYSEVEANLPAVTVVINTATPDGSAQFLGEGHIDTRYVRTGTPVDGDDNSTAMYEYRVYGEGVTWNTEIAVWHVAPDAADVVMDAVQWVIRRRVGKFAVLGIQEMDFTRTVQPRPEQMFLEHISSFPLLAGSVRGVTRHVSAVGPRPHRVNVLAPYLVI